MIIYITDYTFQRISPVVTIQVYTNSYIPIKYNDDRYICGENNKTKCKQILVFKFQLQSKPFLPLTIL